MSRTVEELFNAPGEHFECDSYHMRFSKRSAVRFHFANECYLAYGTRTFDQWDAHPSCLSENKALTMNCARPLWPVTRLHNLDTDEITLKWPRYSGWLTAVHKLLRKNAAHSSKPGAKPWYVNTYENVYANTVLEAADLVRNPRAQLVHFIQVVDSTGVVNLLRLLETGSHSSGTADDVLFAMSLHRSSEYIAEILGCDVQVVQEWYEQAALAIYKEHAMMKAGHMCPERNPNLAADWQNRWIGAAKKFVSAHMKESGLREILPCCKGRRIEEAVEGAKQIIRKQAQLHQD